MVKGLGKVTKTWQLKKGNASDYAGYSNLDVQPMIKKGNTFIPAPNTDLAVEDELSSTGGSFSGSPAPESETDKTAPSQNEELFENAMPNFAEMTVEQLKAYLTSSGVSASDLRGIVKADLVARAEAVWNAQYQSKEQSQN